MFSEDSNFFVSVSCEASSHFLLLSSGGILTLIYNIMENSHLTISSLHSSCDNIFNDLLSVDCSLKNHGSDWRKILGEKFFCLQDDIAIGQVRDFSTLKRDSLTSSSSSCLSLEAVNLHNYSSEETLDEELEELKKVISKAKESRVNVIVGKPREISTPIVATNSPSSSLTFAALEPTYLNYCSVCYRFGSEITTCCSRKDSNLSVLSDKIKRESFPILTTKIKYTRSCPNIFLAEHVHDQELTLTTDNVDNVTAFMASSILADHGSGILFPNLSANKNSLSMSESVHLCSGKKVESIVTHPRIKSATKKRFKISTLIDDFQFLEKQYQESSEFHPNVILNNHSCDLSVAKIKGEKTFNPTFKNSSTMNLVSKNVSFFFARFDICILNFDVCLLLLNNV